VYSWNNAIQHQFLKENFQFVHQRQTAFLLLYMKYCIWLNQMRTYSFIDIGGSHCVDYEDCTSFIKYQRDATYSVYLVYFLQLYMFRTQSSSIFRSNFLQTVMAATGVCYRWRWTRTASETCRVVKNKPNKQNKLHLVGTL